MRPKPVEAGLASAASTPAKAAAKSPVTPATPVVAANVPTPGSTPEKKQPTPAVLGYAAPVQASLGTLPLFAKPTPPDRPAAPTQQASGKDALIDLVARIARDNGMPFELAHGVVMVESRYNPKATGPGGHVGLTQISYPTAKSLGFSGTRAELYDPETNLTYGLKYLGMAYKKAGNDMCGAISKYQAGHRTPGITRAGAAYCAKVRKIIAAGLPTTRLADATAPAVKKIARD
ncbi:lytic transglycosylase domain-containing protein [Terrihabitans sp. B22-R8]|uniref:lytic transglycosylase domain-containing protein n=1 Tax=Terrihabitans sp. B22-R8 TaxID=3425128 RepID=UPI00403D4178